MNEEQLEELRERVERKRRKALTAELELELAGRHNVVDPSVLYIGTRECAKELGVSVSSIHNAIHAGECPLSIKSHAAQGTGSYWAIHPKDMDYLRKRFPSVILRGRK